MMRNGTYDLLLMDVMLLEKNGFDICREIRKEFNLPILMVTARAESTDKIRGLGLGADDYITKPFDPSELVARVKSHLAQFERLTSGSKMEEKRGIFRYG
jgi:DNA-binding response OmpR family regulator